MEDSWWPEAIPNVKHHAPPQIGKTIVAEVSSPWGRGSSLLFFTGLIDPQRVEQNLRAPGGIGYEVKTNTHPSISTKEEKAFTPKAWITGIDGDFEPLVLSWSSANRTTLVVDQGFLLTYGLTPRNIGPDLVAWDDVAEPQPDVVEVKAVSGYQSQTQELAFARIQNNYLQDFATIRKKSLIQVFYIERWTEINKEAEELLNGEESVYIDLPGRRVHLFKGFDQNRLLTGIWGVNHLLDPAESPITVGRWDFGDLIWPGISNQVTKEIAEEGLLPRVFIKDDVLGKYEGRDGFTVFPESGSVSYGNQWSVSDTFRVGRDYISANLKKLYEGVRPDTTKHWNSHAIPRPPAKLIERGAPNVATRSKMIVNALLDLGDALGSTATQILGRAYGGHELVGLDRGTLNYEGIWHQKTIEPITRHIPANMQRDVFLQRLVVLNSLVSEGISEKVLRKIVVKLGYPKETRDFRSLRLLDLVSKAVVVAQRTGLHLLDDSGGIFTRVEVEEVEVPTKVLFTINELRQLPSHRHETDKDLREPLSRLGIDLNSAASGWGYILDDVYDLLAGELNNLADLYSRYSQAN